MAIQVRRGLKDDFVPSKLLPGEWAVSVDGDTKKQMVWMCFGAGIVKRMGTYEDFAAQIAEILQPYTEHYDEIYGKMLEDYEDIQQKHDEIIIIHSNIINQYIPQISKYLEDAKASQKAASVSEANAAVSAVAASGSAQNASEAADRSMAAAASAESSESKAMQASSTAFQYRNEAEEFKISASDSASDARDSEINAKKSENSAASYATKAEQKAAEASGSAASAESYTHGGTGTRTGEDADNAKYYYQQSKEIFDTFESSGSVNGVKGAAEAAYRTGNVNLSAEDVGAVPISNVSTNGEAGIARIGDNGVMEIGKYIDFHDIGSTGDFDARMYYADGKLIFTTPVGADLDGNADSSSYVCSFKKDALSTYDKEYRLRSIYDVKDDKRFWLEIFKNNTDSNNYEVGVDFATKARCDENGNDIATTYGGALTDAENMYGVFQYGSDAIWRVQGLELVQRGQEWDKKQGKQVSHDGYDTYRSAIFADPWDDGIIDFLAYGYYPEFHFLSYNQNGTSTGSVWISEDGEITAKNFHSSGADYAENWEWEDGNKDAEDRIGLFVTFSGNKIRLFIGGDNLRKVGVVSGAPSIIGDSDQREWVHKYKKDIYGRDIFESVTLEDGTVIKERVINPAYDDMQKYIRRSDRPEWDAIGTHGKLVVRDDGTCQPDGFCVPSDGGIATASEDGSGFYVMERLDESHIKIYMR